MNPRSSVSTLSSLKTLLVTACVLAGLMASSLRADTVYVQCGISTYYNGYSDSAPSHTSSTGGFAGTATYKSTATGMVSDSSSTVRTLPDDKFSKNAGFFVHVNR